MKALFKPLAALAVFAAATGVAFTQPLTYQQEVLADNPLAYFRFSGNANDSSGNNYHAGNVGAGPTYPSTDSFVTNGGDDLGQYAFTNSANHLSLGAANTPGSLANALSGASAITLETWIDFDSVSSGGIFGIQTSQTTGNLGLQLRFTQNLVGINARSTNSEASNELTYFNNAGINDGQRHVVAIVDFANGTQSIYVDAILRNSTTHTFAQNSFQITPGSANILLGQSPNTGGFAGFFDEFAVYNYALSPARISAHFNAIPEPSALVFLGLGMGGLILGMRNRRSVSAP